MDGIKPEHAPPVVEQITIKLRSQDGTELSFKVKKTTPFQKIFDAFSKKTGKDLAATRFQFNGERIIGTDTPEKLDMEDDDTVDVQTNQLGGSW